MHSSGQCVPTALRLVSDAFKATCKKATHSVSYNNSALSLHHPFKSDELACKKVMFIVLHTLKFCIKSGV